MFQTQGAQQSYLHFTHATPTPAENKIIYRSTVVHSTQAVEVKETADIINTVLTFKFLKMSFNKSALKWRQNQQLVGCFLSETLPSFHWEIF